MKISREVLIAIVAAATACPTEAQFKTSYKRNLRGMGRHHIFGGDTSATPASESFERGAGGRGFHSSQNTYATPKGQGGMGRSYQHGVGTGFPLSGRNTGATPAGPCYQNGDEPCFHSSRQSTGATPVGRAYQGGDRDLVDPSFQRNGDGTDFPGLGASGSPPASKKTGSTPIADSIQGDPIKIQNTGAKQMQMHQSHQQDNGIGTGPMVAHSPSLQQGGGTGSPATRGTASPATRQSNDATLMAHSSQHGMGDPMKRENNGATPFSHQYQQGDVQEIPSEAGPDPAAP